MMIYDACDCAFEVLRQQVECVATGMERGVVQCRQEVQARMVVSGKKQEPKGAKGFMSGGVAFLL